MNVVGYTTRTVVRNSYNMMAAQFNDVAVQGDDIDVSKVIKTDLPCLDYNDYDLPDFPKIMIKTSDVSASYDTEIYWCCDSSCDLPAGWWVRGEDPVSEAELIALGRGFWFVVPNDAELYPADSYTVQVAGQVPDTKETFSVPLKNNAYIITANPFPVALDYTKITFSAGVPCLDYNDYDLPDFPKIMIKTSDVSASYDKEVFYCSDSSCDLPEGWWVRGEDEPTDEYKVAPGNSFWLVIPDGYLLDDMQTISFSF